MNILFGLYFELDCVSSMSESEVRMKYNSDKKDEIIALINDQIEELEKELIIKNTGTGTNYSSHMAAQIESEL